MLGLFLFLHQKWGDLEVLLQQRWVDVTIPKLRNDVVQFQKSAREDIPSRKSGTPSFFSFLLLSPLSRCSSWAHRHAQLPGSHAAHAAPQRYPGSGRVRHSSMTQLLFVDCTGLILHSPSSLLLHSILRQLKDSPLKDRHWHQLLGILKINQPLHMVSLKDMVDADPKHRMTEVPSLLLLLCVDTPSDS